MEQLKSVVIFFGLFLCFSMTIGGPAVEGFSNDLKRIGTYAKEYVFSDKSAIQSEALALCIIEFKGQLGTPLNKIELQSLTDQVNLHEYYDILFLTGGAKVNGTWEWLTTGRPIESSQLIWYPGCGNGTGSSYSLCFQADKGSHGFCECSPTTPYRFICEIAFRNDKN